MTLITYTIILIKFLLVFLIPLLLSSQIAFKLLSSSILIFTLFLLYKYPHTRFVKLSQLPNDIDYGLMKYALPTRRSRVFNIVVLSIYTGSFIGGILFLRFSNQEKKINIITLFHNLKELYSNLTIEDLTLNFVLFILIFITYISLFIRISQYFKLHVLRLHVLLSDPERKVYEYRYDFWNIQSITLDSYYTALYWQIIRIYEVYYNWREKPLNNYNNLSEEEKKIFDLKRPVNPYYFLDKYKKDKMLYHLLTKWHYLLLLILIVYDVAYNEYIITKIFYILPWTFIYDLYVRSSRFYYNLWPPFDEILHKIYYCKVMQPLDNKTIMIDYEFYDLDYLKVIYRTYVQRGFVKDTRYI